MINGRNKKKYRAGNIKTTRTDASIIATAETDNDENRDRQNIIINSAAKTVTNKIIKR